MQIFFPLDRVHVRVVIPEPWVTWWDISPPVGEISYVSGEISEVRVKWQKQMSKMLIIT